jgi:class 3 adenylate cyclase
VPADIGSDLRSRTSDVQYARAGDAHIAFRVITGEDDGTYDVVLVSGGTMPMDALFEDRVGVRLLDGLASLGRLLVFDRLGIGLSDPPSDWERSPFLGWCDDIETVVTAAGFERAVFVGNLLSASTIALFGARNPDHVRAIAVLQPAQPPRTGTFDDWITKTVTGELDSVSQLMPSRASEPGFREWFDRAGRAGASPGTARRVYTAATSDDLDAIEEATARLRVPILVMRRSDSPLVISVPGFAAIADFPDATHVDLPGTDAHIVGGDVDSLLAEITRFVTGEARAPAPERVLAAVLFSDLVSSTEHAAAVGDARWKQLLDRHDDVIRACVGRRGGTVVNHTGDGVVATLPSAAGAIRAAQDLRAALEREELPVRVGIHVGDIERRGNNIAGVGVVVAARIMALASEGEILVSSTVALAASGEALEFESRGEYPLKGIRGTWELHAVSSDV